MGHFADVAVVILQYNGGEVSYPRQENIRYTQGFQLVYQVLPAGNVELGKLQFNDQVFGLLFSLYRN